MLWTKAKSFYAHIVILKLELKIQLCFYSQFLIIMLSNRIDLSSSNAQ